MKNFILKSTLFSTALVASSMMLAQQPVGTLLFQDEDESFTKRNALQYMAHRGLPLIGDFNDDGKMDFYSNGVSCFFGWACKGVPFENLGDGKFQTYGGFKWDTENVEIVYQYEYEQVPVYEKEEDGSVKVDGEGNPIIAKDQDGNDIYENKKDADGNDIVKVDGEGNPIIAKDQDGKEIILQINYPRLDIGDESVALNPKFVYPFGAQPIDFNQDGLLDYIIPDAGGENTGNKGGLFILQNMGNFQFRKFTCRAFDVIADGGEWGVDGFNENNRGGYISVGDYDHDGFPDFIVQSNHYDREVAGPRNVTLFHNEKGKDFTVADVFDPMPFEYEYCMNRLYVKGEDTIDPDDETGETMIRGMYTTQPTYHPRSLRSSNLAMADFNGDGWLDIVIGGWYDGDGDANPDDPYVKQGLLGGGWSIAFYQNTKDGRFKEVTHNMIKLAGTIISEELGETPKGTIDDVKRVWGHQNGIFVPVDWNQDGVMDLFMNMNSRGRDLSIILLGQEGEDLVFKTEVESGVYAMHMHEQRPRFFMDFNGDDIIDIMMAGGSKYYREDGSYHDGGWTTMYATSNGMLGDYTVINTEDDQRPDNQKYENYFGKYDEGMSYGDIDGDGLMDVVAQVWGSAFDTGLGVYRADGSVNESCEYVRVRLNKTPGALENAWAPDAPDGVKAVEVDGEQGAVQVTWEANSMLATGNPSMYNLYIKDVETGMTFMLVPANKETGKQICYPSFGSYVLAGEASEPTYTYVNLSNGTYEIGVQAVGMGYLASEFTTCILTVTNGVPEGIFNNVSSAVVPAFDVEVEGNAVIVKSAEDREVAIYAVSGTQVAAGRTNEAITVNGHGLFVVKSNGKAVKVVK